jgi:hypothetical protein
LAQRNAIRTALENTKREHGAIWQQSLRVAILHHHLVTFTGQEIEHKPYELTIDAQQVLEMLATFDFHLVLTGHKHQPYIETRELKRPHGDDNTRLVIAGAPTVLGGLPDGVGMRGVRRIVVKHDPSTGHMSAMFKTVQLKNDGTIDFNAETTEVPIRDQAVAPLNQSTSLVPLGQARPDDIDHLAINLDDQSDEWMLFLNVIGCDNARHAVRRAIGQLPPSLSNSLRYISMYDLYGRYDVLLRFAGPQGADAEAIRDSVIHEL